jgi:lia operon protein LiaF
MKKKIWGLVLITLGVLALLQGTGYYNFGLSFWPVVLTLIGGSIVWKGFRKVSWFSMALGLWLGAIGLFSILHAAGVSTLSGGDIARVGWPILLIAAGVAFLTGRALVNVHWNGSKHAWSGKARDLRMVGDVRYGQGQWTLDKDLYLDHGVGDVKVDLTTADITDGYHRITVKAAIGEVLLRVPDSATVKARAATGIGELHVLGDVRNGLGLQLEKEVTVPDAKVELDIDVKLGIGSLRVVRSPAQPGRLHV